MNKAWKEITDSLKDVRVNYPYPKKTMDDSSIEDAYKTYIYLTYGIDTEFDVDDKFVSDIYLRLKCLYPKTDNDTLMKYLNASLHNILNKKNSEENNIKRVKRLKERNEENGFN